MDESEKDDAQVYFTNETWEVLEKLENLGFCKSGERYVLARIAIAVALARGLEAPAEEMKGRTTHYQLEILEPLRPAVQWRYPQEIRPFRRMSNLAHAGCRFLLDNCQELDGNIPFIDLITEDLDIETGPWTDMNTDRVVASHSESQENRPIDPSM